MLKGYRYDLEVAMRFYRRIAAALLVAVMTIAMSCGAGAEGMYYGSHPADDVYMTQTVAHTCTLIAATMMLRNYSCQRGSPYEQVTETGVGRFAWTKQYGLSQSFDIGQVSVRCSPEIRGIRDKKSYLIMCLQEHEEGVVIYDTGMPHAIWLFGYDEDTDTFYCADTITRNGGHAIALEESIIRGATQQDKIDTIDKIWYVM